MKLFEDIEVGDEFAYRSSGDWVLRTVVRLTPTQVIDNTGGRWRKQDGRAVGAGDWDFRCARFADADLVESIFGQTTIRKARALMQDPKRREGLTAVQAEGILKIFGSS